MSVAAPASAAAGEGQVGSETILVVEDDAAVRRLAVTQLRSLGYRVLEVSDGMSAITLLRENDSIDLLFTDVVMPGGMTGRRVAEEGRQLGSASCRERVCPYV